MLLHKPYALKVRLVYTRCAVEEAIKKTASAKRSRLYGYCYCLGVMPVVLLLFQ